jgi:hypothetical protein
MSYDGMLGILTEAGDVQRELGCTVEEAYRRVYARRYDAALDQAAMDQAVAESNVIPLHRKH